MAHSARTRLHTRRPWPAHTRSRGAYKKCSREPPPGKPQERWRRFLGRQLFHLFKFVLRVVVAPQGTPQTAQPVMRIRLGRVYADRLAKMAGRFVGIVLCGENNTQIEVCEPHVGIQGQGASKVSLSRILPF